VEENKGDWEEDGDGQEDANILDEVEGGDGEACRMLLVDKYADFYAQLRGN
jgi:hypothetical protein